MSRLTVAPRPVEPLDLDTVRETLTYIHGDLARHQGLERAATGVAIALVEIENVQRRRRSITSGATVVASQFMPWKR